eukprot:scaffold1284_cov108-Cylindrotheca_fusiformis.AAC.23
MELNNEGVGYLRSKESAAAASHLGRSLQFASHLVKLHSPLRNEVITAETPNFEILPHSIIKPVDGKYEARRTTNALVMYQKVFALNEESSSSSSTTTTSATSQESLCTYSAAICYNLAFLYHQDGIRNGDICSTTKAERLYNSSISILADSNFVFLNESTLLITIAASNNLAVLELEKGLLDAVTNSMTSLAALLGEFENLRLHNLVSKEEVHTFLSNALMASGLQAASAA